MVKKKILAFEQTYDSGDGIYYITASDKTHVNYDFANKKQIAKFKKLYRKDVKAANKYYNSIHRSNITFLKGRDWKGV